MSIITPSLRPLALAALVLSCGSGSALARADGYLKKPDRWFRSDEGEQVIACVLSWQSKEGDWPKNQDTTRKEYEGSRSKLKGTFDNKATTPELRLLARAYAATEDERCLKALEKGIDLILKAQYRNGGWPQYYPPGDGYPRHITFNDGSMMRLMEFLRDVAESDDFEFVDAKRRKKAAEAFERGVGCIVRCQVRVDGKATAWCAQHDERSLEPAKARSYELPSLSGGESAGILRMLMTIDDPSDEVIEAVRAGAAWFEEAKIEDLRVERKDGDKVMVKDRSAPPLWARFYEIETGRPFFCDRDGVKKYELSEIGRERRVGYAWHGNWGESVARDYSKWRYRKRGR